jgi:hypothetical protein
MTEKILYYEVNSSMVEKLGGKYFSYTTPFRSARSGVSRGPSTVGYAADRIWEYDPDTDVVRYTKNRDTGTMTKVDRKEFFLIQLKAKKY